VTRFLRAIGKSIWRSRPVQLLTGTLLGGYLKLVGATTRFVVEPASGLADLEQNQPFIAAMWHGQHFMIPLAKTPAMRFATLISRHGDGEINAIAARMFGIEAIRGSGSQSGNEIVRRGGAGALRTMLSALEGGMSLCLTADVPKIARVAGKGIVTLARHSGCPIVPVAVVTRRRMSFPSWDRASIGTPVNRGAIVLGAPVAVPRKATAADIETARLAVESGLDAVHRRAYELVGGHDPGEGFPDVAGRREAARREAEAG
jgi:lysophospholipid acyltransferase (LPLAT)-like uncharacterized protein